MTHDIDYKAKFDRYEEHLGDKSFFYVHDTDGVFTYISPSITAVLGYSQQAFLTDFDAYLTDGPENKIAFEHTATSMSGKQPPPYVVEIFHQNGQVKWLQVQEFPVFDAQGQVIGVEGLATDITEHKRTLKELQLQTDRFERAQRIAKVGSWEFNLVTDELYWSDEIYSIFELDPEQVQPSYEQFLQLTHPEDRVKIDQAYRQSLISQEPYRLEHRLKMPDGRIKYVLEECESQFDASGGALVSIGTMQDVTEFELTRQEVIKKQSLLSETESIALIGFWELDLNTREVWCSDGCYRLMGFELGRDVVFQDFIHMVPEEERVLVEELIQQCLKTGAEQSLVHRIIHTDGTRRYLQQKGLVKLDENGQPVRIVGTAQDITEQFLAQSALDEQKNLLKSVINATPDLIFFKDRRGIYQGCNPAFEIYTGKPENEIVGCNDFDLFSKEIASLFQEQDRAMFRKKAVHQNEEWVTYPDDGRKVLLDTVKTPYYAHDGELIGLVGVSRDITARKKSEEALKHMAHHDTLTGLSNRELFSELVSAAIAQNEREPSHFAILFIDLDHFKQINDSLGHLLGDQVLAQVGKRLQKIGRVSDSIARLGGDEFAILMRSLDDPDGAAKMAQKVLKTLKEAFVVEGHKLYIGASIGISLFPENGHTPELLLRNADAAMYRAKANDRNTYEFYTHELTQLAYQHIQLGSELRRAISAQEFEVYYQPKYDCHSLEIIGSEALIRWNHPEKGLLLPGSFIQEAEKNDLIIQIGGWVLEQACIQNAQWHQAGLKPGKVSVNLSSKQIAKHDLAQTVLSTLEGTGCQPSWLELEIIERFVMSSPEQTLQVLREVHEIGVELAIDDFGTEYSSLTYLKQLPLSTLKLDYSFVRDIPEDKNDMAIIQAMLALANSFGLKTTAEGVERPEQLNFLKQAGADYFQGFLYSRPLPADQFEILLQSRLKA
ncbi:MAG: EAL domain-containing protein [Thiomicrorhabdus chilensis]|uniref:sensor domain-containing protein n=1 Tax=Thiomicrorhabdus chilensis TaxID=63656 RepID=UPI00299E6624|nr:EAL domain-containing protein [Thiomicrorhabdus chilensis]MDX1347799.1 EAL domain-containing protein [Thiomicrorhabdus chilensis]